MKSFSSILNITLVSPLSEPRRCTVRHSIADFSGPPPILNVIVPRETNNEVSSGVADVYSFASCITVPCFMANLLTAALLIGSSYLCLDVDLVSHLSAYSWLCLRAFKEHGGQRWQCEG